METKWVRLDLEDFKQSPLSEKVQAVLNEAGELLRNGELVAFPTETVYGLGANALQDSACQKIYRVKGRPSDNPLIVHVATLEQAKQVVREWPEQAAICAREFWPGPLTLVLPKSDLVPSIVSGGLPTVAVRMPSHPAALALLQAAVVPVAAPSANISGKPSPTEGKHVWQDLKGKIPLLIDTGKCAIGLESTVLDLTAEIPCILRPGGITLEQLQAVLREVTIDSAAQGEAKEATAPKAPGMKYRHYAPRGSIKILSGKNEDKLTQIGFGLRQKTAGQKIALICFAETAELLDRTTVDLIDFLFVLGSLKRPEDAAGRLFESLRLCDEKAIDLILVEGMSESGIGLAFMNRLHKAAGNKGNKMTI